MWSFSYIKIIQDKNYNHLHFNPGAAGIYGFHKKRTMLKFSLTKRYYKKFICYRIKIKLSQSVYRTN